MTEMMSGVDTEDANAGAETPGLDGLDEQLITQLVDRAKAGGLQLTGEGGVWGDVRAGRGPVRVGGLASPCPPFMCWVCSLAPSARMRGRSPSRPVIWPQTLAAPAG